MPIRYIVPALVIHTETNHRCFDVQADTLLGPSVCFHSNRTEIICENEAAGDGPVRHDELMLLIVCCNSLYISVLMF